MVALTPFENASKRVNACRSASTRRRDATRRHAFGVNGALHVKLTFHMWLLLIYCLAASASVLGSTASVLAQSLIKHVMMMMMMSLEGLCLEPWCLGLGLGYTALVTTLGHYTMIVGVRLSVRLSVQNWQDGSSSTGNSMNLLRGQRLKAKVTSHGPQQDCRYSLCTLNSN